MSWIHNLNNYIITSIVENGCGISINLKSLLGLFKYADFQVELFFTEINKIM